MPSPTSVDLPSTSNPLYAFTTPRSHTVSVPATPQHARMPPSIPPAVPLRSVTNGFAPPTASTPHDQPTTRAPDPPPKKATKNSRRPFPGQDLASSDVRFRDRSNQPEAIAAVYHNYEAQEEDEISIQRGSVVEVLKRDCGEKGWIYAKVDNKEGMVPENYVVFGVRPKEIKPENLHRFEKRLGHGGNANVFRGQLKHLNRETGRVETIDVAIKEPVFKENGRLRLEGKNKDIYVKQQEAIKQEAVILARLSDNKNIVHCFGLCYNPMSLVLEFCEGGTLVDVYNNLKYSVAYTVINWAKQVATGMLHLHERDKALVHADLKGENVLIKERPCLGRQAANKPCNNASYDSNGNCVVCGGRSLDKLTLKITDFGLARDVTSSRRSFDGSVPWMAPERIVKTEFTKPGDVWSFGVLFWEIMMNLRPYSNETIDHMALAYAIGRQKENVRLRIPEKCPGPIKSMLEGCWKYDPNDRPTFKEIISLLDSAMQYLRSKDGNENWTFNAAIQRTPTITNMDIKQIVEEMQQRKIDHDYYANFKPKAPVPPTRSKRGRKLTKDAISGPQDLRHITSIRPASNSRVSGDDKRYDIFEYDKPPPNSVAHQRHRSHNELDSDAAKPVDGMLDISTLPRSYKHTTKIREMPIISKPAPRPDHLVPLRFGNPPKSYRSNPELAYVHLKNICTEGEHIGADKTQGAKKKTHGRQPSDTLIDFNASSGSSTSSKTLERANAFRRKNYSRSSGSSCAMGSSFQSSSVGHSDSCPKTLVTSVSTDEKSPLSSPESDELVTVESTDYKVMDNVVEVASDYQVSPVAPEPPPRPAALKDRRKTSSSNSQSIFYLPIQRSESNTSVETAESSSARESSKPRGIRKIVKGFIGNILTPQPRLDAGLHAYVSNGCICDQNGFDEGRACFHPNHGMVKHLCGLCTCTPCEERETCPDEHVQTIPMSRFVHRKSYVSPSTDRPPSTSASAQQATMRPPYKKRHEYPDQQRRQNRSELMDNSPVPSVPFRSPPTAPRHTPSPGDKHLSIHTVIEPRHRRPSNSIDPNVIIHRSVSPSVHLQGPSRPGSAQSVSDLASITLDSPAGELPASIAHQRSRSSDQNGQGNQVAFHERSPGPLINLGYQAFESTTNAAQKLRQHETKAPQPIRPESSSRPPALLNTNYVLAAASTTTRPSGRQSHSVLDLEIPLPSVGHAEPPGPSLKELRDRKPSPRHVHRDEASTYENAAIPSSSNHVLPPPTPVKQLVILPEKRNRPDTLPIRRRVSLSPNDRESGICTADSSQLRSLPSSGNRQPTVSNVYDHLSPRTAPGGVSSSSVASSSSTSNGRSYRVAPQQSDNRGDELPRSKAPERPPSATKPPTMNCGPYPKVPPIPKQYRLSSVIPQPKADSG